MAYPTPTRASRTVGSAIGRAARRRQYSPRGSHGRPEPAWFRSQATYPSHSRLGDGRAKRTVLPSDFAIGASTFADTAPGTQYEARIFVPVRLGGLDVDLTAMVDTAAPWCVLEGALAAVFADRDAILVPRQVLSSRLGDYTGDLCRASITLLADEGDSLTVEATVFVCPDWSGPNVIGYNALLERIRFAVDPSLNTFYFGR